MEHRAFQIGSDFKRDAATSDLIVEMAFASEVPYERWWGIEVLQMKGARLDRLNSGDGGPVLYNHDWNDLRGRHMPGTVRADSDGVLRGQIAIPQATQATRDAAALIEAKTLTKASVGYQIHTVVEQSTSKSGEKAERQIDGATFERLLKAHAQTRDGHTTGGDLAAFQRELDQAAGPVDRADSAPPVYLVTDWEPLENSLVTIPADNSVGVGRSLEQVSQPAAPQLIERKATMADNQAAAGQSAEIPSLPAQPRQAASGAQTERERNSAIANLCRAGKVPEATERMWITSGMSWDEISKDYLDIQEERTKSNPKSEAALGLTTADARRYSIFNAVRATADKDWSKAGYELECSREIGKRLGVVNDPNKFYVPFEVQQRQVNVPMKRDLLAGTASLGGYLVETGNQSFIELLRNRSVAYRMGARRLSGLVGNVTVPRQTAAATAGWLATEATQITESQQTFGQLALSPKTVGAYTEISRQLLLQSSPDAEGIVTADLATVAALAIDSGVISGSGASGQPTGIVNTAGIDTATAATIAYSHILAMQTAVANANVMPVNGGYVTTPTVSALLMQRQRFTSTDTPLWMGNLWDGQMSGFPAMSSLQIGASSMLFGDWSQVVVAEWGVLQVEVNPYANFQAGIIGVRAIVTVDVGLRYAGAFSQRTSIT